MSAEAIAIVQKLWEQLVFARVQRTIAREPEDVSWVSLKTLIGHSSEGVPVFNGGTFVHSGRPSAIPRDELWKYEVVWRHYFGFTTNDTYFQCDGYRELDFAISLTADFGNWGNHTGGGFKRPKNGDWIAGVVVDTSRGKRFDKWFILTPELRFLIELVRRGRTSLDEASLAKRLLTNGYPDVLWAFARLVMFNNVEAFIDLKAQHPCYNQPYGETFHNGSQFRVDWSGMYLPMNAPNYVHTASYRFGTPSWWERYKAAFDGAPPECVGFGGLCDACEAERRAADPHYGRYYDFDCDY